MRRESFSLLRPSAFPGAPAVLPSVPPKDRQAGRRPLGIAHADEWLGGGLRMDGLHEFHAGTPGDLTAALAFALLLGGSGTGRPLLWLRCRDKAPPYGPGLVDLGLDPAAMVLVSLADGRAVLRAALDGVRAAGAGTVLLELSGRQPLLDLTATRRLLLAAGEAGAMVLIVRAEAASQARDAVPRTLASSAALTRWRVASAPSRPLEADAPGHPRFLVELLRQRGGREGLHLILEWNRDTASFHEDAREDAPAAPLPRDPPALDAGGKRPDPQSRAA